jgi:hypothetical protein
LLHRCKDAVFGFHFSSIGYEKGALPELLLLWQTTIFPAKKGVVR